MREEIVVIVPKDRSQPVKIEANGFVGSGCEIATRGLEAALGGRAERELKPEYHEQPVEADATTEVA